MNILYVDEYENEILKDFEMNNEDFNIKDENYFNHELYLFYNEIETRNSSLYKNSTNLNETNLNEIFFYEINSNETNKNEINLNETNKNEINLNETNKNEIFNKKRRRKIHDKCETGNIRSKIKNNFHKFIIEFLNKKILKKFGIQKFKFRKINYHFTNLRNKSSNEKLMNVKIREFLCLNDVSSKFKNIKKNINEINVKKTDSFLNKYYDLTYAEFYNKYFLKKKYFNNFIENIEKTEKKKSKNYIDYINKIKYLALNYVSHYNDKNK